MKSVKMFSQIVMASLVLLLSACTGVIDNSLVETQVVDQVATDETARSATWTGPNVRLLTAQPFNYAVSGMSWDLVYFYVHVKNIGTPASRVVSIHYKNGAVWTTVPMTLVGSYGNESLYKLDTLSGSTKEFVVKYQSSAGTYWDNNGGANYKVQPWAASGGFLNGVVGGNVGLNEAKVDSYAYFTGTGWSSSPKVMVTLNVEDLSFNKLVEVRYSVNGGAWNTVAAAYSSSVSTGGGNRIQFWKADVYTPAGTPFSGTIKLALRYRNVDTGVDYWDNNFSQDYSLSLPYGTIIR